MHSYRNRYSHLHASARLRAYLFHGICGLCPRRCSSRRQQAFSYARTDKQNLQAFCKKRQQAERRFVLSTRRERSFLKRLKCLHLQKQLCYANPSILHTHHFYFTVLLYGIKQANARMEADFYTKEQIFSPILFKGTWTSTAPIL